MQNKRKEKCENVKNCKRERKVLNIKIGKSRVEGLGFDGFRKIVFRQRERERECNNIKSWKYLCKMCV